jgi:two-component system, OmpR family, phosphate regulon sensor histidine kinase PhoR
VKFGVRAKIFAVSLSLIALSVLAGELYLRHRVEDNLVERIRQDITERLALIRDASEPTLRATVLAGLTAREAAAKDQLHDLAHRLARSGRQRVTFIRPDGVVLGDSDVDRAALDSMENHRDRPEVRGVLGGGDSGASTRWSATVGRRLMYCAMPVEQDGHTVLIARLAVPLTEVDDAISGLRQIFGFGGLVALGAALLLSFGAAHIMSRSLRELTLAAQRMASGDLDVRTHLRGRDEVADLGKALDALAESLSANLSTMRAERDLLGRILESMQEGVLVMDAQRRILLVNPSLREMLALSSEAVGRIAIEVIRNAELQRLLETALTSEGSHSGEIEIVGLKPRRALVHAKAMSGQPGLLAVFVDVTDVRRLESLRRDFVANVSHELRTPIAAVASAAETLRRSALKDPDASVRFVEMIERNARRLHELVEDVLDLSRIESKEFNPRADAVDVGPIAHQVIGTFRERIEQKRLSVNAAVAPGTASAIADHRAVEQVLTNLVENAVKYCPEGSSIVVRVSDEGAKVRIAVEDSGPGIEAKHLPRLFERFYRVDAGRTRDMGGTGLGLSIVKHLVEAMGGMIGVQSVVGRGSTFWFTLPRDTRVATASAPPPPQPHVN